MLNNESVDAIFPQIRADDAYFFCISVMGGPNPESCHDSCHDFGYSKNAICENRATIRVNFLVSSLWWFGVNGFSSPYHRLHCCCPEFSTNIFSQIRMVSSVRRYFFCLAGFRLSRNSNFPIIWTISKDARRCRAAGTSRIPRQQTNGSAVRKLSQT